MANQMNTLINMTCIDSIYKTNQSKETDKLIVGDSFGNIMTFTININELSSNNTKADIIDPTKTVVQLDNIKNEFVKKKIHDEGVTKVFIVHFSLKMTLNYFLLKRIKKIKYIPQLSSFISCSSSETVSLAIEELEKFEKKDLRYNIYI